MIKTHIVRSAGMLGGYELARRLTRRDPKILMYHRFSPEPAAGCVSADTFERQVRTIKRKYRPMTVAELGRRLYDGVGELPDNAVAITVDDGYRDFYDVAWPVLERHGVPATFYVTTGFVDGSLWLWPDRLHWLLDHAPAQPGTHEVRGFAIPSSTTETSKSEMFQKLVSHLSAVPEAEKLKFLDEMAAVFGVEWPDKPPEHCRPATWDQLRALQDGGIEIGGHTVSHPSLARVSLEDAKREILGSGEALNRNLGERPRSFCYPNGRPADFVAEQVGLVRQAGFGCAVVAFADAESQRYRYAMRRHASSEDMFQFNKAVSGVELLGRRLSGQTWLDAYE